MSKKKTAKSKVKSGPAKKAAVVEAAAAPAPVIKPGSSALKKGLITVFAVFLAFNMVELFYFLGKTLHKEKYPVLAASWNHNYKGCTSIGEYGPNIYAIDNTRGDIYIDDKMTGKRAGYLNFKDGAYFALEDSKGSIYVLVRSGDVLKVDPKTLRTVEKFTPEGAGSVTWMDIDSKDNFYLVNPSSSVIFKYDHNFKKLFSFGGRSDSREGFFNAGKIFTGPGDQLYAMNYMKNGKLEIKIFSPEGKLVNEWPVSEIKNFDSLTNMAIAPNGDAYINDTGHSRICVFNSRGRFLGSFSGTEDKTYAIMYAASVTGGKNGLIFVHTYNIGVFKLIDYSK